MDGIQKNNEDTVISQYSRAEAIEDGLLVDVTRDAKRVGIVFPVALTRAVWFDIIEPDKAARAANESMMGRLAQFLLKLRSEMVQSEGDRIDFVVSFAIDGREQDFPLYATLLPGDNYEPVITVSNVDED